MKLQLDETSDIELNLKTLKDYLPFIVTIFYFIGFSYYDTLYSKLGINIMFYTSLTEVLLNSIKAFFVFCMISCVFEYFSYLLIRFILVIIKKKYSFKNYLKYSAYLYIFIIALCVILMKDFLDFMFILFIPVYVKSIIINKLSSSKYSFFIYSIIAFIYLSTTSFAQHNAKEIVKGYGFKQISITTNDSIYSTIKNVNLAYIGETGKTIFLYDKIRRNTLIIEREKIDEIRLIPPIICDSSIGDLFYNLFSGIYITEYPKSYQVLNVKYKTRPQPCKKELLKPH